MKNNNWIFFIILACIAVLGGCDAAASRHDAGEVASLFYESQKDSSEKIPQELFVDEQIGMETENQLNRREMAYGAFISRDRIAVNRQISLKGRERKETFTYVFEVLCEHGRTRETLMMSRERSAVPFLITAYVIEDIPRIDNSLPEETISI